MLAVLLLAASSCSTRGAGGSGSVGSPGNADPTSSSSSSTAVPSQVSSLSPSAVGVAPATVVDPTRPTLPRGDRPVIAQRELVLTIRYPTSGAPGPEELADAPPLGRSPLLVFAHGFDVSASRYAALLHDIAAAGFVVAAPDFPMTSSVYDGAPVEGDLPQQSLDVDAIITQLAGVVGPGSAVPGPILDAIASGPVGIMGHSDGAMTALLSAYAPRYLASHVGAVIAVAGAVSEFGGHWFNASSSPPLLALQAARDEISPFSRSEALVAADPRPAMLVAVDGVSHLGAVTDPTVVSAVAALVADTLAWRLSGSADAAARVDARVVESPLRLVARHGD